MRADTGATTGSHEIPPDRSQGIRPRQHEGHLGGGPHAVQRGPVDRRKGLPPEPAALGGRTRHRRHLHCRQAERVLLDVARRAQALDGDRGRRGRQQGRRDRLVLRPEHGHGDRACQARAGDRRAVHRGACAGAALPAEPRRDAVEVLQDDQRAGRHRHCDVEPRGLRLSDESRNCARGSPSCRTSWRSSTACRARCTRG